MGSVNLVPDPPLFECMYREKVFSESTKFMVYITVEIKLAKHNQ